MQGLHFITLKVPLLSFPGIVLCKKRMETVFHINSLLKILTLIFKIIS